MGGKFDAQELAERTMAILPWPWKAKLLAVELGQSWAKQDPLDLLSKRKKS